MRQNSLISRSYWKSSNKSRPVASCNHSRSQRGAATHRCSCPDSCCCLTSCCHCCMSPSRLSKNMRHMHTHPTPSAHSSHSSNQTNHSFSVRIQQMCHLLSLQFVMLIQKLAQKFLKRKTNRHFSKYKYTHCTRIVRFCKKIGMNRDNYLYSTNILILVRMIFHHTSSLNPSKVATDAKFSLAPLRYTVYRKT